MQPFGKRIVLTVCNFSSVENLHCTGFGFLDDIYLVAACLADAQIMMNDVMFFSRG